MNQTKSLLSVLFNMTCWDFPRELLSALADTSDKYKGNKIQNPLQIVLFEVQKVCMCVGVGLLKASSL